MNSLGQGSQFVVAFFQLILVVALCHDATSCLEPQFTITADKGSDDNSLVLVAIESDKTDATAIGTSVVRLQL